MTSAGLRVRYGFAMVLTIVGSLGVLFSADGLIAGVPAASADYAQAVSVASGGSATTFNLDLPSTATCGSATNQAGGDQIDSFIVSTADVSAAQVAQLSFTNASAPTVGTYSGVPLFTSGRSPYSSEATLPDTGQVPSLPIFSFSHYTKDFGTGDDLYPGSFYVGVACVLSPFTASGGTNANGGLVDGGEYWYAEITFAASTSDPGGFTWTLTPFATSVALSASPSGTAPPGQSVTLTATVSPSSAAGTVQFFDGSTAIGTPETVTVNKNVATATYVTGSLPAGADSITAQFTPTVYDSPSLEGANTFAASTSPALTYTIATSSSTTSTTTGTTTSTTTGSTTATTSVSQTTSTGSDTTDVTSGDSATTSDGSAAAGSSSSADPTLAATGAPLRTELLMATLIASLGLLLLSFSMGYPTTRRNQLVVWPDEDTGRVVYDR